MACWNSFQVLSVFLSRAAERIAGVACPLLYMQCFCLVGGAVHPGRKPVTDRGELGQWALALLWTQRAACHKPGEL